MQYQIFFWCLHASSIWYGKNKVGGISGIAVSRDITILQLSEDSVLDEISAAASDSDSGRTDVEYADSDDETK